VDRKQMKKAFRDKAYEIDKRMGVKRAVTYPLAIRMSLEVDEGLFDNLSPEEFERELENFEFDYLYELYPDEFQRRNQELVDQADAKVKSRIEAGRSPAQETAPPVEDLVRKTKENPSASVPINVSEELKVGGRTRIL